MARVYSCIKCLYDDVYMYKSLQIKFLFLFCFCKLKLRYQRRNKQRIQWLNKAFTISPNIL